MAKAERRALMFLERTPHQTVGSSLQEEARLKPEHAEQYLREVREVREERLAAEVRPPA